MSQREGHSGKLEGSSSAGLALLTSGPPSGEFIHTFHQSLQAHLWAGKMQAGPGIVQGAFILRFPAIDKLNHNTRTANSSR